MISLINLKISLIHKEDIFKYYISIIHLKISSNELEISSNELKISLNELKISSILIWLDSFPLLSQRTRAVLYSPDISTGSKPRPPVLHVTAVSRVNFLFSFFLKNDISWVIIRIEIKMKSSALLPSNLPSVIDRSNLSPSREAAIWSVDDTRQITRQ